MKFLKGIGIFLLSIFALLTALVLICAARPDVTDALAKFLYPDSYEQAAAWADTSGEGGSSEAPEEPEAAYPAAEREGAAPEADETGIEESMHPEQQETGTEGLDESIRPQYISPDQQALTVPDAVSGKNGYQQIQDESRQIEDAAAEALQEQIGTGNTGDGLIFDTVFYPYYGMLDEKGRHLYRQIYANANDLNQTFAPVEQVSVSQLRNVFGAVYNDHPELFWLETAYECQYKRNGQCVQINLEFHMTQQEAGSAKAVFEENAAVILNQAYGLESAYEKEKLVHDLLLDKISYRLGASMSQSAYSGLVNGQTVCAGYARAFQYLMQQLGIPCYYCTGYAGEKHAWNIVSLEDGFYNVDVTWDDTEGGNYDYFNGSDQDYGDTHVRQELSVYLPPCQGQRYRGLERSGESGEENLLRSLADVGMSEEDLIYSLPDYYGNCYDQLIALGKGSYQFSSVIEGGALLEEIQAAYRRNDYRQGYMEQAMELLSASSCELDLEMEELSQDRYLLTHTVHMR